MSGIIYKNELVMQKRGNFWLRVRKDPWSITVIGGVIVLLIQRVFFSESSSSNINSNLEVRMLTADTSWRTGIKQLTPNVSKNSKPIQKDNLIVPATALISPDTVLTNTRNIFYDFTVVIQDDKWLNAKIYMDGHWVANTPNTISLTAGRHHLRIEAHCGIYEEMILIPEQSLVGIPK